MQTEPTDAAPTRDRGSWDDYFIRIAREVSTRATCDRRHVGCVLVRDKCILATGYNGSLRGLPHCNEPGVGCFMEDGHCTRTVHAEANAIAQAARNGVRLDGATAYVTAFPCWPCFKLLVQAGIARIVYGEPYRVNSVVGLAAAGLGVELVEASGA